MKIRKRKIGFFSGFFGILGGLLAMVGIFLALNSREASPILVGQPEAAAGRVQTMLDALRENDYETVSSCLYGTPNLGMEGQAADAVGQLFWEALGSSFTYEILGDFHATDSGVAMDVSISALDLNSATANLKERAQKMLEKYIAEAEDPSEVYDENHDYREDFVMNALLAAAREALAQDAKTVTWNLTLNLVYENGQWWIMPEQALLKALSGGILN